MDSNWKNIEHGFPNVPRQIYTRAGNDSDIEKQIGVNGTYLCIYFNKWIQTF